MNKLTISAAIEKIFPLIEETYKTIDFKRYKIEEETNTWYDRALEYLALENEYNTFDEIEIFYFGLLNKLHNKYHREG